MHVKTFTRSKKHLPITLVLLLFICFGTFAQSQTISGVVTDGQSQPLPGVTVLLKGTNTGTTTDPTGTYSLTSPRTLNPGDILIFSFIGYKVSEIPVRNNSTINAQLLEDEKQLNEVVVTALGIKREQKALGYSVQTIDESQINGARSNNVVSSLSGKVAGLNLISPGSGPVNSTKVILRGENSLKPGNNNALIVVDGVPLSNRMTTSGVDNAYGAGSGNDIPVDFGNGIADLNPDDIESITVLKGASATALYGMQAGNGALIITTKSGRASKGIGVTVNSNLSFNDVLKWPDFQHEYGQGTGRAFNSAGELYYSYGGSADGASTGGTSSAFGPKFNGQMYYQYDPEVEGQSPERVLWQPYKDNVKGFFQRGHTLTNSVSLEGGSEKGSARASITHSKNEWIMPNTGFERFTAALSLNSNLSNKLKLQGKINFTNKQSDNLPATGYNNQSISYFMIFQNPNVDLNWYAPRWKKGQDQIEQLHPFSSFIDNPFVIAYDMTNSFNSYKTIGTISATYELSKKLDVMVRSSVDMNNEQREQRRPFNTANFQRGYYKQQDIFGFELNSDVLATYRTDIIPDLNFRISAGANRRISKYRRVDGTVEGLVIPAVYKLTNGVSNPLIKSVYENFQVNSLYALMTFSYQDKMFLDVTGRNDWSSTLPVANSSFFYPSVSTSFILNEIFTLPSQISFAKLRLSIADVGNGTQPYETKKYYGASDFPSSGSVSTILFNSNILPEIIGNYEAGLEYNLFKRRLGMSITLYNNTTRNQIIPVPLDPTTGYTRAIVNAGKVQNRGIELIIDAQPINHPDFKWNTTVNWAKNQNKVLELAEGMDEKMDIGYGGTATIQARVGGTTGDIYGFGFKRAPDGQIIYTQDGLPARPAEIQYIGNAYADWRGGLLNEFIYKNFKFNILLDGQYGGIVYSQTHHKMSEQGKLEHTLRGREDGFIIGEGVVENGDGTYSPNTKKVDLPSYYGDYYRRANIESNSFDASYLKLRETRLEYTISPALLTRFRFLQGASIALYGRDLVMFTKFPMFDPETAALNGDVHVPGVEIGQLPSTRTYGLNLTFKL